MQLSPFWEVALRVSILLVCDGRRRIDCRELVAVKKKRSFFIPFLTQICSDRKFLHYLREVWRPWVSRTTVDRKFVLNSRNVLARTVVIFTRVIQWEG